MLKSLAIVFCILSCAALQAHSIIPHYHEEDIHHDSHHHHQDDDHDSPISGHTHDAEFGKSIIKHEGFKCVAEKPIYLADHLFLLYDQYAASESPEPVMCPCFESALYITVLPPNIPLRAPPAALS